MLYELSGTIILFGVGFAYFKYNKYKKRQEIKNVLHKYMVLEDENIDPISESDFNKFVEPDSDL